MKEISHPYLVQNLADLPDSFQQLVEQSLKPDEAAKVIWYLFSHPIAPATLLALTEHEVILIDEERTKGASYGWLITSCPRVCVAGIETKPNREWRDVCVRLARNKVTMDRQVTVENDTALAWEALWLSQGHRAKQDATTTIHRG